MFILAGDSITMTTRRIIVEDCVSAACMDCSDEKKTTVSHVSKRRHHGKKNHCHNEVLDFALAHTPGDICRDSKKTKSFSLRQVKCIMKACLIAVEAGSTINKQTYKNLRKVALDRIPYSDWYKMETFPTTLSTPEYSFSSGDLF